MWQLASKNSVLMVAALAAGMANASVVLETAPLGTTGGGYTVSATSFLGARFVLDSSFRITSVGAHVKGYATEDRTVFFAVVPLNTANHLPYNLQLTDHLFEAVVAAPGMDPASPYPHQVEETVLLTDFVLGAGEYALVVGSGLFGATGWGWMPYGTTSQTASPYVYAQGGPTSTFTDVAINDVRFTVEGSTLLVPEPTSILLILVGLAAAGIRRSDIH